MGVAKQNDDNKKGAIVMGTGDSELAAQFALVAAEVDYESLEVHMNEIYSYADVVLGQKWPDWLPNDWGITKLEGTSKKVYVVPGWQTSRCMKYFHSKTDVDKV